MPRTVYREDDSHEKAKAEEERKRQAREEARIEKERKRQAIIDRRSRRVFYRQLAEQLSSTENDTETVVIPPEAISSTQSKKFTRYGVNPLNLMRWEDKYPVFADILSSGKYIFYKGYLCLLSPDCFSIQGGAVSFQEDFVKAHLSEYCVAINYSVSYFSQNHPQYGTAYLRTTKLSGFHRAEREDEAEPELYKKITASDLSMIFIGGGGNDPFSQLLTQTMEGPPKVSQIELHERTGISIRTLSRMMNGGGSGGPGKVAQYGPYGLNEIIACAVALHMHPLYSLDLVRFGGYELRSHVPLERAYRIILCQYYTYSVAACNDYLAMHHLKPLTDNSKITSYR